MKGGYFRRLGKGLEEEEGRNKRTEARLAEEESKQKIRRKTKKRNRKYSPQLIGSHVAIFLYLSKQINKCIVLDILL